MITEQHQKFLARLAASSDAVFAVARWLHSKGRTIEIPAIQYAPTAADADKFLDRGDIIIINDDGRREIVQVKRIRPTFSGPDDWPFKEIFVSNAAAVERLGGDVVAYITVSHDLSTAAIVTADTREHWYVTEKQAKNTGNVERFYACPLNQAKFVRLPAESARMAA